MTPLMRRSSPELLRGSSPKVLIVILNYRTPDLVAASLRSLEAEVTALDRVEVVVVDGGSRDGSAEQIQATIAAHGYGSWCRFVALPENVGFAAGNNAVIRPALLGEDPPDYVHLLNPDTEIREGAVRALVEHLETHPEAGIAGSRLEDPDGTPQVSAFRFPSVLGELLSGFRLKMANELLDGRSVLMPIPALAGPVDWVAGASMMIRRTVLERVGLFDECYFLYYEETDFCLAARRAGFETHYVPSSRVVHLVGQATQVSDQRRRRPRTPRYWFESRERFFEKNHGRAKRVLADMAFASALVTYRVREVLQGKPRLDPPSYWRDFVRYNFLPELRPPERRKGSSLGGRLPLYARGAQNENPTDISLWELLREDFATYDHNPFHQGLWAVALHRLGNARMSLRFAPLRAPLSLAYRVANKGVEILTGIELPYTVHLGRRVRIWHHGGIILHADSIGDDVTIRHNTTFGVLRTMENEQLPVVGNGVDIGVGVSILGGVRVGDKATIGAHAVVLDEVAPGTTVGGIPARPIGSGRPRPVREAPANIEKTSA